MRPFRSLTEQEILALAISTEEEDARIYADLAAGFRANRPDLAEKFRTLQADEDGHRHRLIELYRQKFGEHIPLIRRQDVKGFVSREAVFGRAVDPEEARQRVETMEMETRRFYEAAVARATDAGIRQLLGDLAQEERKHEQTAEAIAVPDERARGRRPPPIVRVAGDSAGPGRVDGWFGLDARAAVRRGICDPEQPDGHVGDVSGRHGGEHRGRHQHGVRGSTIGRRIAHGPRPAIDSRLGLRTDDHLRRVGPHAAIPDPKLLAGDHRPRSWSCSSS